VPVLLVCRHSHRDGAEIGLTSTAWVKTPSCSGKRGVQPIPIELRGVIASSPLLRPMSLWQQGTGCALAGSGPGSAATSSRCPRGVLCKCFEVENCCECQVLLLFAGVINV